jgi:hypothetical protein
MSTKKKKKKRRGIHVDCSGSERRRPLGSEGMIWAREELARDTQSPPDSALPVYLFFQLTDQEGDPVPIFLGTASLSSKASSPVVL